MFLDLVRDYSPNQFGDIQCVYKKATGELVILSLSSRSRISYKYSYAGELCQVLPLANKLITVKCVKYI